MNYIIRGDERTRFALFSWCTCPDSPKCRSNPTQMMEMNCMRAVPTKDIVRVAPTDISFQHEETLQGVSPLRRYRVPPSSSDLSSTHKSVGSHGLQPGLSSTSGWSPTLGISRVLLSYVGSHLSVILNSVTSLRCRPEGQA